MSERLRFDWEDDQEFHLRAERTARLAQVLVRACLENACVQEYVADRNLPLWTVDRVLKDPVVRVEYEQAYAIGGVGECLAATASKSWGEGPQILPLEKEDWFFPDRITYGFKESSPYNRRVEVRRRMKELLGEKRALVNRAFHSTKRKFVESLSENDRRAIQAALGLDPERFWRAAQGKEEPKLPTQGELFG